MIRWLAAVIAGLVLASTFHSAAAESASAPAPGPDLEVFVREGCPHCARAEAFLKTLATERPHLQITLHDVAHDPAQLARLTDLGNSRGLHPIGVPAFLIGEELLVGYDDERTTGAQIRRLLDRPPGAAPGVETLPTSWFGPLDVHTMGLPLFTIAMGLLDGFNPCAMWVLLFLLSLLVHVRDRTTMVLVAGTFVLVSGLVYFAFMAAWLNVFLLVGLSRITELVLGSVALLVGAIHVKDGLAGSTCPSLSIPESAKPGLYDRVRKILQAEHLTGALAGVVVLAVLVNVVELLCTAGLPAVYTRILTMQSLATWQYYGYLALYNLAYIADDSLILAIAVVTLSHHRLQAREGRWLKLLSGCVILCLGLALLFAPAWLH